LQRRSAAHDGFVGRVLNGRYRLEARLGAGAMGVVYRAHDSELARRVAVKVLRSVLWNGDEAEQRFTREAEALAAIKHPAVVTIHDRGRTAEGDPFLIMEFLEGLPLSEVLDLAKRDSEAKREPDGVWMARALGTSSLAEANFLRMAVRWIADLAGGLAAAHRAGVYHRDVKPSNVFLCRDGRALLLDFGLASHASRDAITREDSTLGTPAYMAPESLGAGHRPSAAVDVYGLTATLYHMLTLSAPFSGTPSQIFAALMVKDPPPARKLRPGLPRDLQAILDRGMARRPEDRYTTIEDLERDLRAFLDHRPVQARPLSALTRVWRRARLSPLFVPASVLLVGALALTVGKRVRDEVRTRRAAEYREAWIHVPPALTLVQTGNRVLSDLEGRAEVGALLARAELASDDPLPSSVVRAAFLLDHGEPREAARSFARVAAAHPSVYARALAQRYTDLPSDAAGASAVSLTDLPAPTAAADFYLAAFHAMRAERMDEARERLAAPAAREILPALELELPLLTSDPQRMYEQAKEVEARSGGRSANSAHFIGVALILQQRYKEARDVIAEGLALAPRSNSLHLNAGWAAWKIGDLDAARAEYERSNALKPQNLLGYENLVRVLMDGKKLEEARAVSAKAPYPSGDAGHGAHLRLQGEIETECAVGAWKTGEHELAIEAAELALQYFEEAQALGARANTPRRAIAEALLQEDKNRVFDGLMALMEEKPESHRRIDILRDWLPDVLDAANGKVLDRYLTALSKYLAAQSVANPKLVATSK
jgi:tetratricopeptide (TPR) repeat protein/tRNA A-37 threonylcarbamoyl transferase component Bud32